MTAPIPYWKIISILTSAEERNAAFYGPEKKSKITDHIRNKVHHSLCNDPCAKVSKIDGYLFLPLSSYIFKLTIFWWPSKLKGKALTFQRLGFFWGFCKMREKNSFYCFRWLAGYMQYKLIYTRCAIRKNILMHTHVHTHIHAPKETHPILNKIQIWI